MRNTDCFGEMTYLAHHELESEFIIIIIIIIIIIVIVVVIVRLGYVSIWPCCV